MQHNRGDKLTDYSRYQNPRHLFEQIAEDAISRALLHPHKHPRPGDYYKSLPMEYKEILKNLKSEDLQVPLSSLIHT